MKQTLIAVVLALIAYAVFEGMYLVWEAAELDVIFVPILWPVTMVCVGFIFIDPIVGGFKREQHYQGFKTARI